MMELEKSVEELTRNATSLNCEQRGARVEQFLSLHEEALLDASLPSISGVLIKLANYILTDTLRNKSRTKVIDDEYPVLSMQQIMRRKEKEVYFHDDFERTLAYVTVDQSKDAKNFMLENKKRDSRKKHEAMNQEHKQQYSGQGSGGNFSKVRAVRYSNVFATYDKEKRAVSIYNDAIASFINEVDENAYALLFPASSEHRAVQYTVTLTEGEYFPQKADEEKALYRYIKKNYRKLKRMKTDTE